MTEPHRSSSPQSSLLERQRVQFKNDDVASIVDGDPSVSGSPESRAGQNVSLSTTKILDLTREDTVCTSGSLILTQHQSSVKTITPTTLAKETETEVLKKSAERTRSKIASPSTDVLINDQAKTTPELHPKNSKNDIQKVSKSHELTQYTTSSSSGTLPPPQLVQNRRFANENRPGAYAVSGINERDGSNDMNGSNGRPQGRHSFDNLGEVSDREFATEDANDPVAPVVTSAVLYDDYWRQPTNRSYNVDESLQDTATSTATVEWDRGRLPQTQTTIVKDNDDDNKEEGDDYSDDDDGKNYVKYFAVASFIVALSVLLIVGAVILLGKDDVPSVNDQQDNDDVPEQTSDDDLDAAIITFDKISVPFHGLDSDGRLWKLLVLETAGLYNRYIAAIESIQGRQVPVPLLSGDVTANVDVLEGLNVDTSPQYRAYEWLAEDDVQYNASACNETLAKIDVIASGCLGLADRQTVLERYTFVTLYYALNGDEWPNDNNWLSHEVSVCYWYRFGPPICDGFDDTDDADGTLSNRSIQLYSRAERLFLDQNNVVGALPIEIGFLSNLLITTMTSNSITGTIPRSFSLLSGLDGMKLSDNELIGTIPTFLAALTKIGMLSPPAFSYAFRKISSNILPNIFFSSLFLHPKIKNNEKQNNFILEFLHFDNNQFDGQIPTEIGLMTNLCK